MCLLWQVGSREKASHPHQSLAAAAQHVSCARGGFFLLFLRRCSSSSPVLDKSKIFCLKFYSVFSLLFMFAGGNDSFFSLAEDKSRGRELQKEQCVVFFPARSLLFCPNQQTCFPFFFFLAAGSVFPKRNLSSITSLECLYCDDLGVVFFFFDCHTCFYSQSPNVPLTVSIMKTQPASEEAGHL